MEEAETTQAEDPSQEVEEEAVAETVPETGADAQEPAASPVQEEEPTALDEAELPRALEAVLCSAGEPVTIRDLAELLEFGVHDVRAGLRSSARSMSIWTGLFVSKISPVACRS